MLLPSLVCAAALLAAGGLEDLPLLKGGIKRISSYDRGSGGDHDFFQVAAGDSLVMADVEGAGTIKRIFIKVDSDDPAHLRDMVLRFYWDDAKKPAVESPLGDFFGLGHGQYATIESDLIVTGNKRGMNAYFPMPFRKRAFLVLVNEGRGKVNKVFYQIDYESGEPPPAAGYFHAQYAQGILLRSSADYLLLHAHGRGKYIGTVLSIVLGEPGWFWEGDEKFFVDGEDVPSVRGTGLDDYFGSAWGFEPRFSAPLFGTPIAEGTAAGAQFSAYRFHLADPITFEKDLLVTFEHRGQSLIAGILYDEAVRRDEYYGVAYWYQDGTEHGFAPIPYAAERVSGALSYRVQGEQMEIAESSEDPVSYEVADGATLLVFNADEEGDFITIRSNVPAAGEYEIAGSILRSRDSGVYRLKVNGVTVSPLIDFFNDRGGQGRDCRLVDDKVVFGRIELSAGTVLLRFEAEATNERAEGIRLGIDSLMLRPL